MADDRKHAVETAEVHRSLSVSFAEREEFAAQYVQNFSKGGAFVTTEESFSLREIVDVELELQFSRESFRFPAEIVHCLAPQQAPPGQSPGVAVQFLVPASELREQLAAHAGEEAGTGDGDATDEIGGGTFWEFDSGTRQGNGKRTAPWEPSLGASPGKLGLTIRALRETARIPVEIRSATGVSLRGRTRDVSQSGALISVEGEGLPVGRDVSVRLIQPQSGAELVVPGRVVRRVEGEGIVVAVGVAFRPKAADRLALREFVAELHVGERDDRERGIHGSLEEIGADKLLRMLAALVPGGTMVIHSGVEEGTVIFEGGKIVLAEVGSVGGVKAMARMLGWAEGRFEFRARVGSQREWENPVPVESALAKAHALIVARERLEGDLAARDLSPKQRFQVDHERLLQLPDPLSRGEEAVLELAAANFTLRRILDVIPEEDVDIHDSVFSLIGRGVLTPIELRS